jgi:flavodoxin
MKTPKVAIIYNSRNNKNSKKIAKKIFSEIKNSAVFTVENIKDLKNFDFIIFIIPNIGDEEIPEPFESYLYTLETKNKKYFLCELGNYFGLDYKGCKDIVFKLLGNLEWEKQLETSLDSLPKIDKNCLRKWIKQCKSIIKSY